MTIPYKKNGSVVWTPQLEERFRVIPAAVGNCSKLYYVDLNLPIHVRTDASDYGIGGNIFQLDGAKELPIRFISKWLHTYQLNWSTIEKEALAIFYTVTKYDFLPRDVKFTIETNHKNLTYLKTAQSAKVRCWQLALQEYDFNCIHIAGADNVMADAFSRLCEHHQENDAHVGAIHTLRLGGRADSTTEEQSPVTTEPFIPLLIRAQIDRVGSQLCRGALCCRIYTQGSPRQRDHRPRFKTIRHQVYT
jgi:hypothetical protein